MALLTHGPGSQPASTTALASCPQQAQAPAQPSGPGNAPNTGAGGGQGDLSSPLRGAILGLALAALGTSLALVRRRWAERR